jgi:hypothetical protein
MATPARGKLVSGTVIGRSPVRCDEGEEGRLRERKAELEAELQWVNTQLSAILWRRDDTVGVMVRPRLERGSSGTMSGRLDERRALPP